MPIYPTGKKKDGHTQYRVRINYTEAGKHLQKEKLCYGYREALELEERLYNQYATNGNRGKTLLKDFFEEYLRQRKGELRETSFEKMKSSVERHIIPFLGNYPLNKIDSQTIANWKVEIAGNGFQIAYCQRIYGFLRELLNDAVRMGYIPDTPLKNVKNFRTVNFQAPDEKLHYYTPEQFLKYAEAADASIQNYFQRSIYIFMMIAYYTGMRKGEIHALRWTDIDGDLIRVHRSISQKVKGKPIVETSTKNQASIRSLQIPQPLHNLLNQYQAMQQAQFQKEWTPQYRIVYGNHCVSDTSLSNYNIAWAKAAGLVPIRIHDFRHSHASLLANEGINIQEISRRLGHSNVQITWQTYSHLYPREEERAVSVLNRVVIHEFPTNNVEKEKF